MPYEIYTDTQEVTSTDIHNMSNMTDAEYAEYIRNNLISVDHHDVLRSTPAGYPLATSKKQFMALMAYLRELEPRIGQ